MTIEPVVTADWLKAHLDDANVRVIDIRWSIAASGRAVYEAGHVPGAVFVDLERDLTPETGPGRHPIPDYPQVARAFGAAGVGPESHVVAYDDASGAIASRVWFLLRRYGHPNVSILDGGYKAWVAAEGAVTRDVPKHAARELPLRAASGRDVIDKAGVLALADRLRSGDALLLDARSADRYRGASEPIDARPGHIPGAKSAPWSENVRSKNTRPGASVPVFPDGASVPVFRDPNELRRHYAALGAEKATEIIVYCGSSVTACLNVLGLERAGFDKVRVYEGSWSDWARDASLPAARGDE